MKGRIKGLNGAELGDDYTLLLAWARIKVADGLVQDADDILDLASKRFNMEPKVWIAKGKNWERRDRKKALGYYKKSLVLGSGVEGLVKVAKLSRGEKEKIDCYSKALSLGLSDGSVYNAYGGYLTSLGRVDEAEDIFGKGLRVCTRDRMSLYHGHAKMLIDKGEIDKAKETLEKGIEERREEMAKEVVEGRRGEQKEAFLRHTLGMLYLKEGSVVKAQTTFTSGIVPGVSGSRASRLLLGAALCASRLGDLELARSNFDKAVQEDGKHAHAYQAWSIMEIKADNFTVAKTLVECGLANCPNHGALWQVYASLENRLGNTLNSQDVLFRGIEKCRNHVPLYLDYAMLKLKDSEGIEDARRLVETARAMEPRRGNVWVAAFKVEEIAGNADSCRKVLEEGLHKTAGQAGKDRVKLLKVAGDFFTKYGRYEQARALFSEGLDLDDTDASIYHSWAQMEASIFNLEGLNELNKRAVSLFSTDALAPRNNNNALLARRKGGKKLPPRLEALWKRNGGVKYDDLMEGGGEGRSISDLLELDEDGYL
ncbi:hypothetical protein TrCOL_g12458 [Triparma columacea]|uniref:Suppressor of forked domain-containing protein n=1 Tax=Triparma columacea TaxID=722753 RepID=A0A9W7L2B3_9STRA|nr:hypothetical protein TrCOL_g12458 [Triparma columacea]